jgi:uncharacterized OsmC-like protein
MERSAAIRRALDRAQSVFAAKPAAARVTKGGRATLKEGLTCEYVEGGRKLLADMPVPLGGEDKALSPGGYARAGLSMCLAIGYAVRAAHRGVVLRKVEVDIECDTDLGSVFGFPGIPAGYSEFRYSVRIESEAPETAILALVDEADQRSPVLDAFGRAQKIVRSIAVSRPETV